MRQNKSRDNDYEQNLPKGALSITSNGTDVAHQTRNSGGIQQLSPSENYAPHEEERKSHP